MPRSSLMTCRPDGLRLASQHRLADDRLTLPPSHRRDLQAAAQLVDAQRGHGLAFGWSSAMISSGRPELNNPSERQHRLCRSRTASSRRSSCTGLSSSEPPLQQTKLVGDEVGATIATVELHATRRRRVRSSSDLASSIVITPSFNPGRAPSPFPASGRLQRRPICRDRADLAISSLV